MRRGDPKSGCAFLAHLSLLKQEGPGGDGGVGGGIEDFLAPKEMQDISSQQAVAALLPSLLGFRAVRFASNGPVSEKKPRHQSCILVWQRL